MQKWESYIYVCCRCVLAKLGPGQLGPGAKLSPFCGGGGQLSSGQTIWPWAQLPGARLSGARFSRSPFDYHMSLANWALDSWAQTNGPRGPTVLGPIYLVTEDVQIFSHINCTLSLSPLRSYKQKTLSWQCWFQILNQLGIGNVDV